MDKDKRRKRRVPIKLCLEVSSVFHQDHQNITGIHAPIEIIDISSDGIGFNSESELPVNYYFNARLIFDEIDSLNNSINCVVKIVRKRELESGLINYGCEFVGMSVVFDTMFKQIEENHSN